MAVYHGITSYIPPSSGVHVALGFFDGVHRGHRAVLSACADGKGSCSALALTFSDSPAVLLGRAEPCALTDNPTKAAMLRDLGIDDVIFADFDQLRRMSAADFVHTILCERLHARAVYCGYNYHFGCDGGDTALLRALCEPLGIAVWVAPPVYDGDIAVSSSAIREAIRRGDITAANRMLGYSYAIRGDIRHGNHIGSAMGYPTVNLPIADGAAVPAFGVYASRVTIDGAAYTGATNIGVHPTVGANPVPLCETFLLDAPCGDLYGKTAVCALLRFLRPEQRFASADELTAQVSRDIEKIRSLNLK